MSFRGPDGDHDDPSVGAAQEAMTPTAGGALAERLRARLPEIERTIFTRIEGVSDPHVGDPEYLLGLRRSVKVAMEYALGVLEHGEEGAGSIPAELLDQARKAARNRVSLDTVLRRYLAGHTLLVDLVIKEVDADRSLNDALQELLGAQATSLDRLLAAVAEEHSREAETLRSAPSARARRLRTVERLLAGEPLQAPELGYDLDVSHTALIASGPEAQQDLREVAGKLDRNLLLVHPDEMSLWVWLGGRQALAPERLLKELSARAELLLAVGEPGAGLAGWRESHRQARAAWSIAQRRHGAAVRYADVAILASVLQDGLLLDSLRRLYLEPLEGSRNGGKTLRETLRAYFAAERSAVSAAAALGVTRQAVSSRLRLVEQRIGRSVGSCAAELEVALRIHELGGAAELGDLPAENANEASPPICTPQNHKSISLQIATNPIRGR